MMTLVNIISHCVLHIALLKNRKEPHGCFAFMLYALSITCFGSFVQREHLGKCTKLMASKVAMRPSATRSCRDVCACAAVHQGSGIPEHSCQLPTTQTKAHTRTGTRVRSCDDVGQDHAHAPIPTPRNRSAHVLLFLSVGIGVRACSYSMSSQELACPSL